MSLRGKNAIITGARSGIGLATLRLFASKGCNCWAVVHRNDSEWLTEIETLQQDNLVWIKPVHINLEDYDSIKAGVQEMFKDKLPIDILVNAAGIVSENRLFTMTKLEDIRRVMEVNFFSILELIQLVSRKMMRQNNGSIINIASIAADCEDTSQLEYATSKAALVCATKKLARELAPNGIRVNAVSPGLTQTKMVDSFSEDAVQKLLAGMVSNRFGKPEEVASVVAFLADDESSFVNGVNIKVDDGGYDLRTLVSR